MAAVSDWIERWQPLLAASVTFLAACIFAVASTRLAHSLLGAASAGAVRTAKTRRDLRVEPKADETKAQNEPDDLIQDLERIRSVARSALSTLTSSDDATASFFAKSYASCLRLTDLTLDSSTLPAHAPQAAHRHLETLQQHIAALRSLNKQMPASEISEILINVHGTARHLARTLQLRVETQAAAVESDRTLAQSGRSSNS